MTTTITLTAILPGAIGNSYPYSAASTAITPGGSNFSGGLDYPTTPTSVIETGKRTFDVAADAWTKDKTNALTALQHIADSEFGLIYVARNGAFTFRNQSYLFLRVGVSPTLITNSQAKLSGGLDEERLYNKISVQFAPRTTLAPGVIAASTGVIQVPPRSGKDRYNTNDLIGGSLSPGSPGVRAVTMPFVDPTTGQTMGALSVTLPLVPYTDFTVNERSDGTGPDYTPRPGVVTNIFITAAVNGSNIELSFTNIASGPLYVTLLKVRGTGLVSYNPITITQEDASSEAVYGKSDLNVPLPLPSGQVYAESLGYYLLRRYKDPAHRIEQIAFERLNRINGTHLLSLEIGDVVQISDYQTAFNNAKYVIMGISYFWSAGLDDLAVTFNVRDLDLQPYWILGTSQLGVNTRLAI